MTWLEVSMTVDGEMAEAVAEVLARYIPDGVVIESTAVAAEADDEGGHAVGPLRVCGYLPMDANLEETRRKIEEGLWYLGRIRTLPAPLFKPFEEVNWVEAWKEHYHPIPIGERLVIVPAWLENPPGGRIPIRIDPGMAFGTGTHPTTQLCLELLDRFDARGLPQGYQVLDIGCGSGILAVAALELGASYALGVDIDPLAVDASRENALSNGVSERLALGVGSVAEVCRGQFDIMQAELVFANILAPIILRLFKDGLAELVKPGGILILSGILADQSAEIEAAAAQYGLQLVERRQVSDWVAFAVKK
ncbi:MAG: ribosomal protein L11 methyltransferase [Chloroflexi bacterium RBG_19FT_COMBO_56_12]|nr:MAG: ribosomal protein L11 methyltransferase [Chloroflexi bacterium RBG_19FT_COMBO_56_12]